MTKDELLQRLQDIEWEDFECKQAKSELPKSVWETVSAFSNTSGGWIVLGVREEKVGKSRTFVIEGVGNAEKLEQDLIGTLRSKSKFNVTISVRSQKYDFDGKTVLAFFIPSSTVKPVYYNNNLGNTFIRSGSGDQHANDAEIAAIQRDQAFGSRSELEINDTSFNDINHESLQTFRRRIQQYNEALPYNQLGDEEFCRKIGVTLHGKMTYGGLLMLGKRDSIREHIGNFWIDFIEIPGDSSASRTRSSFSGYVCMLIIRLWHGKADLPMRTTRNSIACVRDWSTCVPTPIISARCIPQSVCLTTALSSKIQARLSLVLTR